MPSLHTANPLLVSYTPNPDKVLDEKLYELRTKQGELLARAHEDLGDSGGMRLLRSFTRGLMDNRTVRVDDPDDRPLLTLHEERRRHRSRTSVVAPDGTLIGTIIRNDHMTLRRQFEIRDAHDRRLATLATGPKSKWNNYPIHDPDKRKIGRIRRTGTRSPTLEFLPTFKVRQVVAELPEPLPLLLRLAPMPLNYAEYSDR